MIPEAAQEALRADLLPFACAVLFFCLALGGVALVVSGRRRDLGIVGFILCTGLYGARLLGSTHAASLLFGVDPAASAAFRSMVSHFILVPFVLFFATLLPVRWRPIMRWLIGIDSAFAVVAITWESFARTPGLLAGPASALVLANLALTFVPIFFTGEKPTWELRRLRLSFLAASLAVPENLHSLGLMDWPRGLEPIGFLLFFAGLGTIVAHRVFAGETRLAAVRRDLETAQKIQASILPGELPRLAGLDVAVRYMPAEDVAGDFYDFLPAGERRLGVLVADVSGHGVPAALIASMIKVAVAAQADHAASPAEVLTRMNRIFHGKLRDHFITAAYVVLDLDAMRLVWANAGHPPPLFQTAGGIVELAPTGAILGRLSRAKHEERSLAIAPGDRLLLFTDGIPECRSPSGELFGDARLQSFLGEHAALAPESLAAALLARLATWAGSAEEPTDDLTLVVLQVQLAATQDRGEAAERACGAG